MTNLEKLRQYAMGDDATCDGIADRLNRLDSEEWESVLRRTEHHIPITDDRQIDMSLAGGDDTWSVIWWDATGRRVIARAASDGEWSAEVDPA